LLLRAERDGDQLQCRREQDGSPNADAAETVGRHKTGSVSVLLFNQVFIVRPALDVDSELVLQLGVGLLKKDLTVQLNRMISGYRTRC